MIIKFPNWYEHFQGLGFDLDQEPKIFNGILHRHGNARSGATDQHLQQYESYQIFRYFENIKPGDNGGGWVDTYDVRYIDRYARAVVGHHARQGSGDHAVQLGCAACQRCPAIAKHGVPRTPTLTTAGMEQHGIRLLACRGKRIWPRPPAIHSLKPMRLLANLGKPIGLTSLQALSIHRRGFSSQLSRNDWNSYRYLSAISDRCRQVLLTESANSDPQIVDKIKGQLHAGKNVVITSGLLHALQGHGIEDIVEMHETGQMLDVNQYWGAFGPGGGNSLGESTPILVPRINFLTNDAWPVVRATANGYAAPLLLMDRYSKGMLFVLTIPENFNDLYSLPQPVLTALRSYLLQGFPVQLDAPSQVSLFVYDNNHFVVQSFRDAPVTVTVSTLGSRPTIRNISTGATISGKTVPTRPKGQMPLTAKRPSFTLTIPPHSFVAFAEE